MTPEVQAAVARLDELAHLLEGNAPKERVHAICSVSERLERGFFPLEDALVFIQAVEVYISGLPLGGKA
jgi:hypothetical protein